MERYFVGNNTAYGFRGYYEETLKSVDPVILLKGGPGTGKSSMLKKIASDARAVGYDVEMWYCSGDPASLDGVYIKALNAAIVDATAPHATGADLPMIKDFIYDLATGLSHEKLTKSRGEIEDALAHKKENFARAYQRLRLAKCHLDNIMELEAPHVATEDIRVYASLFAANIRDGLTTERGKRGKRRLFSRAICPEGNSAYFDHLRGKKVYRVIGGESASRTFVNELAGLVPGGTLTLDPLDPSFAEGIIFDDVAIVRDAGHAGEVYENIDLGVYEDSMDRDAILEEESAMTVEIAFAKEKLNRAREAHLSAEQRFVEAMDFDNNARILREIERQLGLKD